MNKVTTSTLIIFVLIAIKTKIIRVDVVTLFIIYIPKDSSHSP